MKTTANTTDPEVTVSVRQTEALSAKGKGHPETTAVAYVERAFERLGVAYWIDWDFRPVAGVPDPKQDKHAANRTWVERVKARAEPGTGTGADLLLTTLNGGGMSNFKVGSAICPAGTLTEDYSTDLKDWVKRGDPRHPVFGILHELGHCLGSRHDVNWGRTWCDDGVRAWYRTPCAFAGTTNLQGDPQTARPEGYEKRDVLSFADDATDYVRFRRRPGANANQRAKRRRRGPRPAGK